MRAYANEEIQPQLCCAPLCVGVCVFLLYILYSLAKYGTVYPLSRCFYFNQKRATLTQPSARLLLLLVGFLGAWRAHVRLPGFGESAVGAVAWSFIFFV